MADGLITSDEAREVYIELAEVCRCSQLLMHALTSYQGRYPVPFTPDQLADAVHWATAAGCTDADPGEGWHGLIPHAPG